LTGAGSAPSFTSTSSATPTTCATPASERHRREVIDARGIWSDVRYDDAVRDDPFSGQLEREHSVGRELRGERRSQFVIEVELEQRGVGEWTPGLRIRLDREIVARTIRERSRELQDEPARL
jgi:hypothetical protein